MFQTKDGQKKNYKGDSTNMKTFEVTAVFEKVFKTNVAVSNEKKAVEIAKDLLKAKVPNCSEILREYVTEREDGSFFVEVFYGYFYKDTQYGESEEAMYEQADSKARREIQGIISTLEMKIEEIPQ